MPSPEFIDHVMSKQNSSFVEDTQPIVVPHINEHVARSHPAIPPAPAVGWNGPTHVLRSADARHNTDPRPRPSVAPQTPTGRRTRDPGDVPEWVYTNVAIVVAPIRFRSTEEVEADPEIRAAVERAYWLGHNASNHQVQLECKELHSRVRDIEQAIDAIRTSMRKHR